MAADAYNPNNPERFDVTTGEADFAAALDLHRRNLLTDAAIRYEQAVQKNPLLVGALNNLGACLHSLGRSAEAVGPLQRAILLQPTLVEGHLGLAQALAAIGNDEEAANAYRSALAVRHDMPDAWLGLAAAFTRLGRFEAAHGACLRALELRPEFAEALSFLGNVQRELGQFAAAVTSHRRALELRPELPEIAWNYALSALITGNFAEGWRYFDRRLDCPGSLPRTYPEPRWNGRQSLHAKTIFLYPELGYGDTINFVRFAPQLKELGAFRVVVECQPALVSLLRRMRGIDQVIPSGESPPPFDLHLALIDLLPTLKVGLKTVPGNAPYLAPPAIQSENLVHAITAARSGNRKVGVVWAGDSSRSFDRNRSIPAAELLALADEPGHTLFSLQKDKRPGDHAAIAARSDITDLAPLLRNFDDAACAIDLLDLVISVDTAVAHLAGAIGKPVWLLLRYASDWRYPINVKNSLWYSSMRIFRQKSRTEWHSTLAEVATALREP